MTKKSRKLESAYIRLLSLVKQGYSAARIAALVGVTPSAMSLWLKTKNRIPECWHLRIAAIWLMYDDTASKFFYDRHDLSNPDVSAEGVCRTRSPQFLLAYGKAVMLIAEARIATDGNSLYCKEKTCPLCLMSRDNGKRCAAVEKCTTPIFGVPEWWRV